MSYQVHNFQSGAVLLASQLNEMDNQIAKNIDSSNIAKEFSASSTYTVGDYVIYGGQLYQCTTAVTTAGLWNSSNWTQAVLGNDVGDLKSALSVINEFTGEVSGFEGINATLSIDANSVTATKGEAGNWYALYVVNKPISFFGNGAEYIPIAYGTSPDTANYDFFLTFVNNSSANFGTGYVFARNKNTGTLGVDHAITSLRVLNTDAVYSPNPKLDISASGTEVTIIYNGLSSTIDISTVRLSTTKGGYFSDQISGALGHLSVTGTSYTLTYDIVTSKINDRLTAIGGYRWAGKTWCAFGDSITALGQYEPLVKAQLNLSDFENMGVGGSTIAELYSGQTAAYCNRYDTIATGFDVITILGGTNDFGKNIPLGTKGSTDKTTFYGGLSALLSGIKTKFQTTTILFFTPMQRDYFGTAEEISGMTNGIGVTLKQYRDVIIEMCEEAGIPCFDMYSMSGLYPENVHTWTTDGLHPNQTYWNTHYQLIGDFINRYIPS